MGSRVWSLTLDCLNVDVELLGVGVDVELVVRLLSLEVFHDRGSLSIEFSEELELHVHHFFLLLGDGQHPLVVPIDLLHDLALLHLFFLLDSCDIVLLVHLGHEVTLAFGGGLLLLR